MNTLAVTRDFNLQTNWDRGEKKKKKIKRKSLQTDFLLTGNPK